MLKKINDFSGLITLFTVISALLFNFVEFKTEIQNVSASVGRHNESCAASHKAELELLGFVKSEQSAQAVNNRFLLRMAENSNNAVIEMNGLLKQLNFLLVEIRNEQNRK